MYRASSYVSSTLVDDCLFEPKCEKLVIDLQILSMLETCLTIKFEKLFEIFSIYLEIAPFMM